MAKSAPKQSASDQPSPHVPAPIPGKRGRPFAKGHTASRGRTGRAKGGWPKGVPTFNALIKHMQEQGFDLEAALTRAAEKLFELAGQGDLKAMQILMSKLDLHQGVRADGGRPIVIVTGIPAPEQVKAAQARVTTGVPVPELPTSVEDLL